MIENESYYFELTDNGYKLTNKDNKVILIKQEYGLNFISEDNGQTWKHYVVSEQCPNCHGSGIVYK